MKTKIRYRYLATRGGYVSLVTPDRVGLEVDITQELHVGEQGQPVFAVSKSSTVFSGWSDGVKSNPRVDAGSKDDYPIKEVMADFRMNYWWERFFKWIWVRRNQRRR